MSEHIIDAFIVKFGLDPSGFKKGAREVETGTRDLSDQSKKSFDTMEQAGRKTGEAIKSVSREVIGLGLAFMGARSIIGFAANMLTGAASADRLGQRIGVTTDKIWAWRLAMKSVGGQAGDADASLGTLENIKTGIQSGTPDVGALGKLSRLGVTPGDIQNMDSAAILSKLAGSQMAKSNPELYNKLLSDIGLPASTISLLMQGKGSVDTLIKSYQGQAGEQEKLAKKAEDLQSEMADLNAQLQNALVPVLSDMVPLLKDLVGVLTDWLGKPSGGDTPKTAYGWAKRVGRDMITGERNVYDEVGDAIGGKTGDWVKWAWGRNKHTRADRNNNPGNIEDGAFAKRQAGYAGGDGRFAKFASADHGFAAMETLLGRYVKGGNNTLNSIISKWAPGHENNVGAYVGHVSRLTGINPNQRVGPAQLAIIARAMALHEGYSGGGVATAKKYSGMMNMHQSFARHSAPKPSAGLTVHNMTVHTQATDGHGLIRDVKAQGARRLAVSQADRVVSG